MLELILSAYSFFILLTKHFGVTYRVTIVKISALTLPRITQIFSIYNTKFSTISSVAGTNFAP